ncbi:MAG TPA: ABC transporter substrate-binding protein [Stellaceae bacterium]|nr:ABC transporter substrate-binding protein [Stellaceae bacterium]
MNRIMAALAAALVLTALAARADETLGVNAFPGAANLPLLVGQHEGMFHKHGIEIALSHPKGSVDQLKGLMDGKYAVLLTALDNVVAYHDGHGEADLGGPIDLVAFMGMDTGFLSLMASPGTKTIADLEGKTMAVDALTTGFSFALQELLARGGVAKDKVSYAAFGSSGARWKALSEGKAQAALLNMPFDLVASDQGFVKLATVAQTLGHYQATAAAVRESWAKEHPAILVSFLRGYRESVRWMVAPKNKDASIAILHGELPDLDAAKLARIYALLTDPKQGIARDLAIDPKGAAMVLTLRARYAAPAAKPAHDWRGYVDLSYLARSRK